MKDNADLKSRLRDEYMTPEEKATEESRETPEEVKRSGWARLVVGSVLVALSIGLAVLFSDRKEMLVFCGLSFVGFQTLGVGLCSLATGKRWDALGVSSRVAVTVMAISFTSVSTFLSLVLSNP